MNDIPCLRAPQRGEIDSFDFTSNGLNFHSRYDKSNCYTIDKLRDEAEQLINTTAIEWLELESIHDNQVRGSFD